MEFTKETLAYLISLSYQEGFKTAISTLEGVLPEVKKNPSPKHIEDLLNKILIKQSDFDPMSKKEKDYYESL